MSRSNLSSRRRGGQIGEVLRPEEFRRTLTIGFLPETSNFTAFRYCSAPDPCVLAADPSFFVPDRCGSGVEKTVLSQLTRRPTTINDEARTGDEGRGWRGKELDSSCDFLHAANPAEGNPAHDPISEFGVREERSRHGRFEKGGSDRVHSNVVRQIGRASCREGGV